MQGGAGRRTGLSAQRARRTKSRGYSRPRQTMADQSILKSAVLPASPMPLLPEKPTCWKLFGETDLLKNIDSRQKFIGKQNSAIISRLNQTTFAPLTLYQSNICQRMLAIWLLLLRDIVWRWVGGLDSCLSETGDGSTSSFSSTSSTPPLIPPHHNARTTKATTKQTTTTNTTTFEKKLLLDFLNPSSHHQEADNHSSCTITQLQ